jgi:hypothetical protein
MKPRPCPPCVRCGFGARAGTSSTSTAYVAASTTVAINTTMRGFPCNEPDNSYNCPHTMVTPAVSNVAAQHFACPSLVR